MFFMRPQKLFNMFFILFISCTSRSSPITDPKDEDLEPSEEVVEPSEEEVGTDEDGDGFTVENGDCDDTSPWINPLMKEEIGDNQDNDCDGRVDEKWSGIDVSVYNPSGRSKIQRFNILGDVEMEVDLENECIPTFLDHALEEGWVTARNQTSIAEVALDGSCTILADFSENEEYPYVYGVISHPNGYYLAVQWNRLIKVEQDGTVTELVTWSAELDDTYELSVQSIAVDIVTGEIGLFGYYGGFATYHESEGLVLHRQANIEEFDGLFAYSGTVKDGGGYYSLVYADGNVSIRQFDFQSNEWSEKMAWTSSTGGAQEFAIPNSLTIDGDHGDYYITANVASYQTIWRLRENDSFVGNLYQSNSDASRQFLGIVSNY